MSAEQRSSQCACPTGAPAKTSLTQEIPKDEWQPDSGAPSCSACNARFSLHLRRHHCRRCGFVYCKDCSSHAVPMRTARGDRKYLRVCDACKRNQHHPPDKFSESWRNLPSLRVMPKMPVWGHSLLQHLSGAVPIGLVEVQILRAQGLVKADGEYTITAINC